MSDKDRIKEVEELTKSLDGLNLKYKDKSWSERSAEEYKLDTRVDELHSELPEEAQKAWCPCTCSSCNLTRLRIYYKLPTER